ncbi:prevent-host-death protein [candidate division KSB1 bacterium]|nr:prevent-host-death protein [candidate division KSB1 bacterium]
MSLTLPKPSLDAVQYISDTHGKTTGVIVPIDVWQEMIGERETAYLLSSARMKARLLEAKARQTGLDVEVVREKLGI